MGRWRPPRKPGSPYITGAGYRQLEAELHGDAWLVVDARAHDILHPQPETLWWEVVGRQPGAVGLLRHYPEEPWLN